MSSILVGLVLLSITAYRSFQGTELSHYFQAHSLSLVVVGALAIMFLTFTMGSLRNMMSLVSSMFKAEKNLQSYQSDIQKIVSNRFASVQSQHPMVSYAQQLWEQGVNNEVFVVLLSEKKAELDAKGVDVILSLKNLAKYPPALGMVGTVMGMIELFGSLESNQDHIGEALSVTMTATLIGLILSNIIISPLADRLQLCHMKEQRLTTSLYELMLLINNNQPSSLINEEIKGRVA